VMRRAANKAKVRSFGCEGSIQGKNKEDMSVN